MEHREGTEEEWNRLPRSKVTGPTEWDDILVSLASDKIEVIPYTDEEQLKTMKRSLGRVAGSRAHIKLEYRHNTQKNELWVRKSGDVTPKPSTGHRGRPKKTE